MNGCASQGTGSYPNRQSEPIRVLWRHLADLEQHDDWFPTSYDAPD